MRARIARQFQDPQRDRFEPVSFFFLLFPCQRTSGNASLEQPVGGSRLFDRDDPWIKLIRVVDFHGSQQRELHFNASGKRRL